MDKGTIKFYKKQDGFGFIIPDNGGDDVFFNSTHVKPDMIESLRKGANVTYGITKNRRTGKPHAEMIRFA